MYSREMRVYVPKKHLYKKVHICFIHNSQNLKDQMSMKLWMDKQIMVYPYNGIILNYKKEGLTDTCNNMNESEKCYVKQKKPDAREYIPYNLKAQ